MSIDNIQPNIKIVNGGEMLIFSIRDWERLLEDEVFQDKLIVPKSLKNNFERFVEFIKKYKEFDLGVYLVGQTALPSLVLKISNSFQRVHIERITCEKCGWSGETANPMVADLYFGIPNKLEELKNVEKIPLQPCPRCGSELPRHPIWVEPIC